MGDVLTTTASVASDTTAFEQLAYFALRPRLHFDQAAEVRPTKQSHRGAAVQFNIYADLATNVTALNESVDFDAVALSDSTVTVTLVEQGNGVITTAKLRGTSFLDVDRDAANIVGFNAGESLDEIARDVLDAGTNAIFAGDATSTATIDSADTLSAANVRQARAELRGDSVQPWPDNFYRAYVHPDTALDLRAETGTAAWREPHLHTDATVIKVLNGEVGAFEGFRFIETEKVEVNADGGSGLVDVYNNIFVGRQALAKAWSSTVSGPIPQIIFGPVTDKAMRFQPVSWYWLGGYTRFREASIRRIESASSIGDNA